MTIRKNPSDGRPGDMTGSSGKSAMGEDGIKMQANTEIQGSDVCQGLDARLQAQIGHKLKTMFDEVASAPVPDKFLELLRQLDGKERD